MHTDLRQAPRADDEHTSPTQPGPRTDRGLSIASETRTLLIGGRRGVKLEG